MNRTGRKGGAYRRLLPAAILLAAALILYIFRDPFLTAIGTLRSAQHTVACLGDSVTYGAGVKKSRETDAWTFVLNDMLGSDYTVLNFGQNGATLQEEGDRPYRDTGFLPQALQARAGTYILMLGANDSKPMNWNAERYAGQLENMILTLRAGHWKHRVVLMKLPKAFPDPKTGEILAEISDEVIREEINPVIEALSDQYSLTCIDLYTLTQDHPEWFSDGVHPNREGNRQIAELIFRTLWE